MRLELYYPTKPWRVNQGFGENATDVYKKLGLDGHNGIDSHAPDGWIIRAAHSGTVTFTGEDGSGGVGIVIRTNEACDYNSGSSFFKTIYWHIRKDGVLVKAGQKVTVGDIIALADNTGLSTGSHLHFGLKPIYQGENDWEWWNAEQDNGYKGSIDPSPYFTGFHAADYSAVTKITETLANVRREVERIFRIIHPV